MAIGSRLVAEVCTYSRPEAIREGIDRVRRIDIHNLLFFCLSEEPESKPRCVIEAEPADGTTIVVVQQNCAVALGVAHDNTSRLDDLANDGTNDVEPFHFFG